MPKRQALMLLGALTAIILFLGFPEFWDKILLVAVGLLIIIISYRLPQNQNHHHDAPYTEHRSANTGPSAPTFINSPKSDVV